MPFRAEIRRESKESRGEKKRNPKYPTEDGIQSPSIMSFVTIGSPAPIMLVCINPIKKIKKRENGEYMKWYKNDENLQNL
jgi:hypothetical protein